VTPSVVRLTIARDEPWAKDREEEIPTLFLDPEMEEIPQVRSFGSGVLIDRSGVIFTNAHVVGKVKTCEVFLGESREAIPGKVLASDRDSDLALVRIEEFLGL